MHAQLEAEATEELRMHAQLKPPARTHTRQTSKKVLERGNYASRTKESTVEYRCNGSACSKNLTQYFTTFPFKKIFFFISAVTTFCSNEKRESTVFFRFCYAEARREDASLRWPLHLLLFHFTSFFFFSCFLYVFLYVCFYMLVFISSI